MAGDAQLVVPVQSPAPDNALQLTLLTPTLSLAVPFTTIVELVVESDVEAGDVIVSVGGVVSFGPGGFDGGVEGGVVGGVEGGVDGGVEGGFEGGGAGGFCGGVEGSRGDGVPEPLRAA